MAYKFLFFAVIIAIASASPVQAQMNDHITTYHADQLMNRSDTTYQFSIVAKHRSKIKNIVQGRYLYVRMDSGEVIKGFYRILNSEEMAIKNYSFRPENIAFVKAGTYPEIAIPALFASMGCATFAAIYSLRNLEIDLWGTGSTQNEKISPTEVTLLSASLVFLAGSITVLFFHKQYHTNAWDFRIVVR